MEQKIQATFGHFKIDGDQGVFHKNGTKLQLRPKELAVFCLLVQRSGELVTKEQIIKVVWNGIPTSDESIARCISVIKTRLRESSPGAETLIRTEYGRGYRFVGNVSLALDRRTQKEKRKTVIKLATLGEIASKDMLTCSPDTTVLEVARILNESQRGSILITQGGEPIGIWTESDATRLNLEDPSIFDIKISEVMNSPIVSIEEWRPISDAVVLMRSKGIRHLLVTDRNEKAYGVVSQTDVVHCHGVESFMTVKNVRSIAYRTPLLISDNILVSDIVRQMRQNQTDISIIQLPGRELISFTERDLVGLIADKSLKRFIGDLDIKPLESINDDTSLLAARQLMEIKQIKHLAVLDNQGHFVKILNLSDILADLEYSYVQLLEEILDQNNKVISGKEDHIQMLTSAMQQTAGMILITNRHGDLEYVNESFEKITGYTLAQVKGKNPRFLSSGVIPKSVFRSMWEAVMSGKTWKGELCNQKKSGEQFWVLISITPIVDEQGEIRHFIAVEEDISERKELELRLREIEQRFYEMADHSPVMIWESGPDGRVHFLNKYWLEFTGRKFQEQVGNGWAEQLHPDDLQTYLDAFQKALIGRSSFSLDHHLKNAAGEFRWVMNSGVPRFNEQNDFLGFRGSCADITDRKLRELEAQNLAYYDHLTGLATRSLFSDRLDQALLHAKREATSLTLLNIDLDRFKPVNDMYGHLTGDVLLQQVAERLLKCVRKSDTVCRYGGDEFLILAANMPKKESGLLLAKKILKSIDQKFLVWGHEIEISCSIGLASFPTHATTKEQLITAADEAMFRAKQLGKARISF